MHVSCISTYQEKQTDEIECVSIRAQLCAYVCVYVTYYVHIYIYERLGMHNIYQIASWWLVQEVKWQAGKQEALYTHQQKLLSASNRLTVLETINIPPKD